MGFDCSYQGVPESSGLIQKAYDDPKFAEDVFYPVVAFAKRLENKYYCKERDFFPVGDLYSEYPEIGTWNFRPASRMHDALIYMLTRMGILNLNRPYLFGLYSGCH